MFSHIGKMVLVKNDLVATWCAMEKLIEEGLVRKIGVCNFSTQLLRHFLSVVSIPPSILQVELHVENSQNNLLRFAIENCIRVTGFSALGGTSYIELGMAAEADTIMRNKVIQDISFKHNKSTIQVVIRWAIQRNTLPLIKTSIAKRMIENRNVFDFYLYDEDMRKLDELDQNKRYNDPGVFTLGMGTFCPIYE